jgi:hypothetical protein
MKKSTKILIGAVAVTLAVCVLIVAVASHNKQKPQTPDQPTASTGDTTYFDLDPSNVPDLPTNAPTSETEAPVQDLSKAILGKWMDSANMSGYEFQADGTVAVTYVNLTIPFINLPINGSATGTYSLNGNELMIKYSIYTKTIVKRFFAAVNDNELSLRDLDEGDTSTYRRASADAEYSTTPAVRDDDLTGTWVNADATVRFVFNADATVNLTFVGYRNKSVSRKELNGSYTGLYMTQGNFVTIQFMDGNDKITLEYTYQVSRNTLALTDKNNETTLFVRAGTGSSTYATAEDLRGKWRDSTGTNGYNFKEGGIVELTLVNFTVPVINMPINGTYNGTYQVDGDKLTIRYSVFGKSITDVYRFSVEGGTLTLTNEENGKVSSYMR